MLIIDKLEHFELCAAINIAVVVVVVVVVAAAVVAVGFSEHLTEPKRLLLQLSCA